MAQINLFFFSELYQTERQIREVKFGFHDKSDTGKFCIYVGWYCAFRDLKANFNSTEFAPYGIILEPKVNFCIILKSEARLVSCALS